MRWAVIVAGGSGSRFWPLSSPRLPKQLLALTGPTSTAEATLDRLLRIVDRNRILLVTGPDLAGPIGGRLGLPKENVLVEPEAKSTGPALAWAAHEAGRRDPEAVVLSSHADWHVPDADGFVRLATRAFDLALRTETLVTVGIVPTRPETGYGYIVPGAPFDGAQRVAQFREKPAEAVAADLIAGGALWNSGLFAWRASVVLSQFRRFTPEIAPGLDLLDQGDVAGFFRVARPVSIDIGLLERSPDVAVLHGDFAWDDVGNWEALARVLPADDAGNVLVGNVTPIDSQRVIAWSAGIPIVVAGLSNLVVVEANGRILIMARDRAPDLKAILDRLPPGVREI